MCAKPNQCSREDPPRLRTCLRTTADSPALTHIHDYRDTDTPGSTDQVQGAEEPDALNLIVPNMALERNVVVRPTLESAAAARTAAAARAAAARTATAARTAAAAGAAVATVTSVLSLATA